MKTAAFVGPSRHSIEQDVGSLDGLAERRANMTGHVIHTVARHKRTNTATCEQPNKAEPEQSTEPPLDSPHGRLTPRITRGRRPSGESCSSTRWLTAFVESDRSPLAADPEPDNDVSLDDASAR